MFLVLCPFERALSSSLWRGQWGLLDRDRFGAEFTVSHNRNSKPLSRLFICASLTNKGVPLIGNRKFFPFFRASSNPFRTHSHFIFVDERRFDLEGHGQVSVAAYFQMHYGYRVRYPHLPCIIAASNRANLPLEVRIPPSLFGGRLRDYQSRHLPGTLMLGCLGENENW
jgi:hypothetical protein